MSVELCVLLIARMGGNPNLVFKMQTSSSLHIKKNESELAQI
ncbi:hypothetical protein [Campylobacter vulpis]|nr:hypothetical protein [Campylobacter vulpis]